MIKKIAIGIVIVALVPLVVYFELVSYGLTMAKHQLRIIYEARPNTEVLADNSIADSLKIKIRLVEEIRKYAFDSMGLHATKNYSTFYLQKERKPVLWTVSACPEFSLEAYEWSFPLIGKFPYKGYFDLREAEKEAEKLKKEGYDTDVSPVSGWSTLGWFTDPILSGMLRRPEAPLAELIIHEISHSTFFVKDDAVMNENLANFIGKEGTMRYLESKYGKNSPFATELINEYRDDSLFTVYMLRCTAELQSMYEAESFKQLPIAEKRTKKNALLLKFVAGLKDIPFADMETYGNYFEGEIPDNAFFVMFTTYEQEQENFEQELKNEFNNDLRKFIKKQAEKYPL